MSCRTGCRALAQRRSTRPGVSSELSVVRSIRVMALSSQAACQSFFTVRRAGSVAARRSRAERFITTQRIHEGNGLDQTLLARDALAAVGDEATSQIMDYIMADEVLHVRSGIKWVERLVPSAEERDALLRTIEERLGIAAVAGPPLNREGRRKAGFTEIELDWLTSIRDRRGER